MTAARPHHITEPTIQQYLHAILPARCGLLADVEAHAAEYRVPIVGPLEARLLYVLVRSSGARQVLELGTATGYSALWFAAAVAPVDGEVTTIELSAERAAQAQANFVRSEHGARIRLLHADAFAVLPTLPRRAYDLVFNDLLRSAGEDRQVPQLLELALERVRPGGLLVSDNVLCGGQVALPAAEAAGRARAIAEYNRRLLSHPALDTSVIPIRDGVAVSYLNG